MPLRVASSGSRGSKPWKYGLLTLLLFVLVVMGVGAASGDTSGRIVFVAATPGRLEVASVRPDGTMFQKLTHHDPVADSYVQWARDDGVVFWASTEQGSGWWSLRGRRLKLLPGTESAAVSPTGRYVAEEEDGGLRILDENGRTLRRLRFLTPYDFFDEAVLWSRDERYLAAAIVTDSVCCEYERTAVIRADGSAPARFLSPRRDGVSDLPIKWIDHDRLIARSGGDVVATDPDGGNRRVMRKVTYDWDVTRDGQLIAYVGSNAGVYAAPFSGGHASLIRRARRSDRPKGVFVCWAPDGTQLAISDSRGLDVVRRDHQGVTAHFAVGGCQWSEDSTRILDMYGGVVMLNVPSHRLTRLTRSVQDDAAVASPDGSRIAFLRGIPAFRSDSDIAIFTIKTDGRDEVRIGRGYDPAWSPASDRLAYVSPLTSGRPAQGDWTLGEISVSAPDGRDKHTIAIGTRPAWSPDGQEVAFMRYAFDKAGHVVNSVVWVAAIDGSTTRLVKDLTNTAYPPYDMPVWTPDGKTLLLHGYYGFVRVDVATGEVVEETEGDAHGWQWSPSGDLIAYTSSGSLHAMNADGTADRRIAEFNRTGNSGSTESFDWSPSGKQLAFDRCDARGCDIFTVKSDGTALARITHTGGVNRFANWSP